MNTLQVQDGTMISRAEQVVCEVDLRQYQQMQAAQAAAQQQQQQQQQQQHQQQQQQTNDDHIRTAVHFEYLSFLYKFL